MLYCLGFWFSPECDYVRECVAQSQHCVEGSVNLLIYKGSVYVTARHSRLSLYSEQLVR